MSASRAAIPPADTGRPAAMQAAGAVAAFDVSVVVALYNKAPYVARALRSALDQTAPPREIVVVDDGSTDGGAELVERLAAEAPAIRLLRQPNAGPSAARNRGIAEAGGAWIAFLDADDVLLPGHLARLGRMAVAHPQAGLLAAAYTPVTEGEQRAAGAALAGNPDEPASHLVDDFYRRWCRGPFFFTSSLAIRRDELMSLGEVFPQGESLGEDHDVWFRLAERTPVAWTPAVGALYTVGLAESLTGSLPVTEPLPCFQRLRDRLGRPDFPAGQRLAARRLLATHWLNVARARALVGDVPGAWRLLADPIVRPRPLYGLRSLLLVAANSGPWRPLRLGRI